MGALVEPGRRLARIVRSPATRAVQRGDVRALRDALKSGADVEEAQFAIPLLRHAVNIEADGSAQWDTPLHMDLTALLPAREADPPAEPPRPA
ncbi:hypothetical protein RM844_14105 [Streptomyces sp. DSM 44915]|uniref:Uncharacterized protein n=1 Tax=Streptomyces chisholmiae TaxID=3075540 RepID=A0ABU2JR15_9ACTN|nr:hypothetical protein [Streptomyces sp. DSM 44915]MDT0267421.1 hypothetical protein [Streptomyces sp. DSM 44915]